MLGIIGIAICVGLVASVATWLSGYSLLLAFGVYALSGWLFILIAITAIYATRSLRMRSEKQDHAYSG
ncbi:hypothetical protein [Ruegeria sp. HKCCC2117]|uniref:hypothetical protein n=1 Tax=Ruegeria sp. HKCCC2117 TaxID=2682992 RepID=UPI001488DF48|nr:hypothetical protein [Ruegeria sp. HKCCC2117]